MSYYTRRVGDKYITKSSSVFGVRPYTYNPYTNVTNWEKLTAYMSRKFLTRTQVKTLIRKKWLAVCSFKSRLYVSEICPDEISNWFL